MRESIVLIEKRKPVIVKFIGAEVVEPGRHARLRGVWGNPCGFKSRLRHHYFLKETGLVRIPSE